MPTLNPRVQVTLSPEKYDLLKRISSMNGESMSAILSDLFDVAVPVLERLVIVSEALREARESMPGQLQSSLQHSAETLEFALGEMASRMEGLGEVIHLLDGGAAGPRSGTTGPEVGESSPNPRIVTRGSGSIRHTKRRTQKGEK